MLHGGRGMQQVGGADGVTILGVYGIGGSGKSTQWMNMANYYSKDFLGRSCWLELPSTDDESMQLLLKVKEVLPTFAQSSKNIFTLEQVNKNPLQTVILSLSLS
eukprot:c24910_g2_i2 orf=2-310(-)